MGAAAARLAWAPHAERSLRSILAPRAFFVCAGIDVVLGFTGATAGVALIFVFPGLLARKLYVGCHRFFVPGCHNVMLS